jgi:hypothetical protein
MRSYQITIYYSDKPEILEDPESAPKRSFLTPWIRGDHGLFRVDLAIIGPEPEETENNFSLAGGELDRICQAIADLVKSLEEELR